MIKTTYEEIALSADDLQVLGQLNIRGRSLILVARICKLAQAELDTLRDINDKLIRKYGEETADGRITVTPGNMDQFKAELDDILSTEVTIQLPPLPLSTLDGVNENGQEIAVDRIIRLSYLFELGNHD